MKELKIKDITQYSLEEVKWMINKNLNDDISEREVVLESNFEGYHYVMILISPEIERQLESIGEIDFSTLETISKTDNGELSLNYVRLNSVFIPEIGRLLLKQEPHSTYTHIKITTSEDIDMVANKSRD